MSTNVITTTVRVDGVEISDGTIDDDNPVVLSGLRVTWGRRSQIDPTAPSSCTFTIDDPTTGNRLVPSLTIGRPVEVQADTVIYPDPDVSTITQLWPTELINVESVDTSITDINVLVEGGQAGRAMIVVYPPAEPSSDPTAWDLVPRTLPGQQWMVSAIIGFPEAFAGWQGYGAYISPVGYTDPAGTGSPVTAPIAYATPIDPVAATLFLPPPGEWLGVQVSIYRTGPTWDDLDPAVTWDALPDPGLTWDDLGTFIVSDVDMLAPAEGAAQSSLVFSGRITDIDATWDGGPSTIVQVIAQGWMAELENRFIGDDPWPMQTLGVRAQRIAALSGQGVQVTVDPTVADLLVTWRDVDNQAAAGLLQELAASCGGVLWAATHLVTGQQLWLEDPAVRPAALTLSTAGTGLVHVVPSAAAAALPVSACMFDVDPVKFTLDASTTASTVAVQWLDQVLDTGGQPAPKQRTVEITDPGVVAAIGVRRVSVSTQLATAEAAELLAVLWLARLSEMAWRLDGLVWDTSQTPGLTPDDTSTVMTLLDGTRRIGLPLALTDFPDWALPLVTGITAGAVPLYVEGGTYSYIKGAWRLELTTSSAKGSAVGNLVWDDLDAAWTWDDMDPDMTWLDLFGVGVTYP